ncbi:hypothetical protein TIFTF001_055497 [Ficus carica]|uniref:Uncharacterized protein n=1 Tax=Ficus carica TaxID=3494 RepID=A0AA88EBX3_FICCA|nr:hypothetical protein TIFTF001_055489 [Ficus carica]GMN70986.1 hypothetical protein TIFTF001_055493 [Ficus carica]GMN70998.1 hypothetical protein TIFTF001_055496 [Ficus carica]GMN71002.1 hypothetical protein TIFTF001_055497 [Ficus carica]
MPSIERSDEEPDHLHPEYTEHPWSGDRLFGSLISAIPGTVHLYTFPEWSDLRVAFSAWRVLGAPSAEQILKPSLSKPSTLGTEYRTGLAPTSIPGPYSASNPGLGIGHVDDPPAADATHLLLSPVKSPPAANHSDGHCCPFTGDAHDTLSLTVQGLGPRGVHLLGQ